MVDQQHDVVSDALLADAKVTTIVESLLTQEQWRLRIYPALEKTVNDGDESTLVYFSVFHEATVLSLVELLFFNPDAVLDCGDMLLDVVDYCCRWLQYLINDKVGPEEFNTAHKESLKNKIHTLSTELAFKSLAVLRYITDVVNKLNIAVVRRILYNHNVICLAVRLLETKPWSVRQDGKLFKFDDGAWRAYKSDESDILSKTEAQIWIMLYNLMVDPACRQVYHWTNPRKAIVSKLRDLFTRALMDQFPMLEQLARVMEECLLSGVSEDSFPYIEEVGAERWTEKDIEVALETFESVSLDKATSRVQILMDKLSKIYDMDEIDDILPGTPKCASCNEVAVNRCSRCKNEWYCGRACQVKVWKDHKPFCDILSASKANKREV